MLLCAALFLTKCIMYDVSLEVTIDLLNGAGRIACIDHKTVFISFCFCEIYILPRIIKKINLILFYIFFFTNDVQIVLLLVRPHKTIYIDILSDWYIQFFTYNRKIMIESFTVCPADLVLILGTINTIDHARKSAFQIIIYFLCDASCVYIYRISQFYQSCE